MPLNPPGIVGPQGCLVERPFQLLDPRLFLDRAPVHPPPGCSDPPVHCGVLQFGELPDVECGELIALEPPGDTASSNANAKLARLVNALIAIVRSAAENFSKSAQQRLGHPWIVEPGQQTDRRGTKGCIVNQRRKTGNESRSRARLRTAKACCADDSNLPTMRETLANGAPIPTRANTPSPSSAGPLTVTQFPVFLRLVDDAAFRAPAISLLTRFDDPRVPETLLGGFEKFSAADRTMRSMH